MSKFKILFILLVLLTNTSQAQTGKSFIGKWLFQDMTTTNKKYEGAIAMMKKASAKMVYYYDANNQYFTKITYTDKGVWSYNETTKAITMVDNKGKTEVFVISKLTDSLMIVNVSEMDLTTTLTFKKVPTEASDIMAKPTTPNVFVSTTAKEICKKWFIQKHENGVLTPEMNKTLGKMHNGTFHEFRADFTYTKGKSGAAKEDLMNGKWEFGKDNKSIITTVNNGNKTLWSIKSIKENELILVKGEGDDVWWLSLKE
jgi:hypothetical protein